MPSIAIPTTEKCKPLILHNEFEFNYTINRATNYKPNKSYVFSMVVLEKVF